jgi:uncharacterized membrane protein
MGCRVTPYWLANFAFDMCVCLILFAIYSFTVLIFMVEPLNHFIIYCLFLFTFAAYVSLAYTL